MAAPTKTKTVHTPIVIPDEFQDYTGPSLQGQYAGFVSRAIAFSIDLLIVLLIITVMAMMSSLFIAFFDLGDLLATIAADRPRLGSLVRALTAIFSFGTVAFLYSVLALTVTGGLSIGRGLMGVRVVRMDGLPISVWRSLLRYFAFYVAALPLGLGLFWVIWDDKRQGWHDKIAKTCVIYDWPAYEKGGVLERMNARLSYMRSSRQLRRDS